MEAVTDRSLAQVLASIQPDARDWQGTIPDSWLQGRTCYGGLSSAIAHHVARLAVPDAPPLRSAQISFIGPIPAGPVRVTANLLRRGKSTCFVETRLMVDGAICHSAQFIFAAARSSAISIPCPASNDLPPCPADGQASSNESGYFTRNFEYTLSKADFANGSRILRGWNRLKARDPVDVMTQLLAVADVLPPAAMAWQVLTSPISSMNWQVNLLEAAPTTDDGWWLLESAVDHADHGASSQMMTVYNSRLQPVMKGMQAVAVFG